MLVLFLQKKKKKTAATTKNIKKKVLTVFGGLGVVTAFTANG